MTKKKVAVITMVFNESVFLPIWLHHYGSIFGFENLFIIDDGSNDDSCQDIRIANLIKKNRGVLDEDDRSGVISYFHAALLEHFETVIYTDVDELLVVDPRAAKSLYDYLINSKDGYKTAIGLNVLHHIAREAELDFEKPLFEQRRYVQFAPQYCKTLVSKIPLRWMAGFHKTTASPQYDPNLFLFHLRAMDMEMAKRRIRNLNTVQLSDNSASKSHALQFGLSESDYVERYFSTSEDSFENAHPDLDFIWMTRGNPGPNRVAILPPRFSRSVMLSRREIKHQGMLSDTTLNAYDLNRLFSHSIKKMLAESPWRSRNELCPCGSNKRAKHCHGS